QIKMTPHRKKELNIMLQMVDEAEAIIASSSHPLEEFGRLLHESWKLKRALTKNISNASIDEIYEAGRSAGALGGKLLGAGGGGFILFFAKPKDQPKIKEKLKKYLHVPFNFENSGSQIIYYSPNDDFTDPFNSVKLTSTSR